jgi:tetratricopeptide (TPR) repeat protein
VWAVQASSAQVPEEWARAARDPTASAALLRTLAEERAWRGVGDLFPLSSALLALSSTEADGGAAKRLAELAAAAAPRDPRPHRELMLRAARERQPVVAAGELVSWLGKLLADPWAQGSAAGRLAATLWAGALAGALALLAAGVAVYGPLCFHDYADAFPSSMRRIAPWALLLLLVVAFRSAGLGPGGFAFFLGLVLMPYFPRPSRWALGGCLTVAGLLFPSLCWMAAPASGAGERAWALYRAERGDRGPRLEAELAELFPTHEPSVLAVRASLARASGKYGEAARLLQSALTKGGQAEGLRLELGNLYFLQGFLEAAAEEYARATAEAPNDARPWLNQHLINLQTLALTEADRALERAQALDGGAQGLLQVAGVGRSGAFIPVSSLPSLGVRQALLRGGGEGKAWVDALARWLFFPSSLAKPGYLGLLALVGTAAAALGKARRSRRCPSCGETICPRCSRRVRGSELCPACWALQHPKGRDAGERERRQRGIQAWVVRSARWRRAGAALLPGWGPFAAAPSFLLLAVGVLWSLSAGTLLLSLLYPAPVLAWSAFGFPWGAASVLLALHGWNVRGALFRARARRR